MTPWPATDVPWGRIHVDFARPFYGKHFLVIVDAFSGWQDAYQVRGPTTEEAVRGLTVCFRFNGLPYTLVSDNGAAFSSHRFRDFCFQRGIKHLFTAPRNPSSNGAAERLVRSLKDILRRLPESDFQTKLDTALDSLRSAPGPDGRSPSERLMGRTVRTALSLVRPSPQVQAPVLTNDLSPGDTVWYMRHGDPKWRPAKVDSCKGNLMVVVREDDGYLATRHLDQLRRRAPGATTVEPKTKLLIYVPVTTKPPQTPPVVNEEHEQRNLEQTPPRNKRRSMGQWDVVST